jgi:glutamate synthase (ferredoxin)
MSGGTVYVLDFEEDCLNSSISNVETITSQKEMDEIKEMIQKHVDYTGSTQGKRIIHDWESYCHRFTKIIPDEYKHMMESIEKAHSLGLTGHEALSYAYRERYSTAEKKEIKNETVENIAK